VVSRRTLFLFESPPLPELIPGSPSPASPRGMGVNAGLTETTERTGKTRSVASGPNAKFLGPEKGDGGASVTPEKMLTGPDLGIIPTPGVRAVLVCSSGVASATKRRWLTEDGF
jgi:hypothetical protein